MSSVPATPSPADPARADVLRAWLCLLLLPVAFFGAFVVGEGIIGLLGYPVGGDQPPYLLGMVATIPALVVFAIPALVATHYARRAARAGTRTGWIPAGILLALTLAFVVLNTVPMGQ